MGNIRLTKRDLEVLASLGEYGVLDTAMIHQMHFQQVTSRRCQQRLLQYVEHGLCHRTQLRVWYDEDAKGGKIPTIFSLSERGASVIFEATGSAPKRVLRSSPKPETLFHRLDTVRWRVGFDAAFKREQIPAPTWIVEQDMRADLPERVPPNQRSVLFHRYSVNGQPLSCKPDAASLFSIPNKGGALVPLIFYWEIDRSTEGHQQISRQKIRGYTEMLKHRPYVRYWPDCGDPAIRIVFACKRDPRERRESNLAQMFRDTALEPYVRFISMQNCHPAKLLRAYVWRNPAGDKLRIING